jgi:hypothetical protein
MCQRKAAKQALLTSGWAETGPAGTRHVALSGMGRAAGPVGDQRTVAASVERNTATA